MGPFHKAFKFETIEVATDGHFRHAEQFTQTGTADAEFFSENFKYPPLSFSRKP
jgi:hypothetical protein